MNHARRWKLSSAQRADMWSRWKAGQSLNEIGRALGKDHVVIQFLLARHGGIAPAARRRSRQVLTLAEREDISHCIDSKAYGTLRGGVFGTRAKGYIPISNWLGSAQTETEESGSALP